MIAVTPRPAEWGYDVRAFNEAAGLFAMDNEKMRGVVEHTLAVLRQSLNNMVAGRKYDADEHNLCIAIVEFTDGSSQTLAAYSNDSALQENYKGAFDFLGLVPNTFGLLQKEMKVAAQGQTPYACNGMAQYHTEPKLLNYLAASPAIRRRALWRQRQGFGEEHERKDVSLEDLQVLNRILKEQRRQAYAGAARLGGEAEIAKVTLASEIDCCPSCVKKTIMKFNERYPDAKITRDDGTLFELGKKKGKETSYQKTMITRA
jgi:hypothetical protein